MNAKEILEALKPHNDIVKEYPLTLNIEEQKLLLDYITNLQEELKEYKMIFDTFSKRPYAHRYLEEKKKELGNNKIIGLDSEMIYKDYYNLKSRNEKAINYINNWVVDEYSIAVPSKEDPDVFCEYEPNAIEKLLNILNGDDE